MALSAYVVIAKTWYLLSKNNRSKKMSLITCATVKIMTGDYLPGPTVVHSHVRCLRVLLFIGDDFAASNVARRAHKAEERLGCRRHVQAGTFVLILVVQAKCVAFVRLSLVSGCVSFSKMSSCACAMLVTWRDATALTVLLQYSYVYSFFYWSTVLCLKKTPPVPNTVCDHTRETYT